MLTNNIKAVLFDLDGCLIDACEWHYVALNKALGLFGYGIGKDDHLKVYNGLPTAEKLKMMTAEGKIPLALHDIIKDKKKEYTLEQIEINCKPDYAKIAMIVELQTKGLKLACCSNARQKSVEKMLDTANLIAFFDEIIGNDVGFKPKPSPEIYQEAMKRLNVKPEECIIIEDAPHGIKAAKATGAKVIEVKQFEDVNMSLFNLD